MKRDSPLPACFSVREAGTGDGELLLEWVKKLAAFENLSDRVFADAARLSSDFFGRGLAKALFVETEGRAVAFAVWFYRYSTFAGRPALFLEDIFVDEAHRGQGIASGIFGWLEARAREEGCSGLEWSVLEWNASAKAFYRAMGGKPKEGWELYGKELR
jgi:GNAT superfamily N-acetyltransferase